MKIIGDSMAPLFPIFQCVYWKQRMSFHFLILIGLLVVSVSSFGQGSLSGRVTDVDTKEPIPYGDIVLYKNGVWINSTKADIEGNYSISNLDVGTYDIYLKNLGVTDSQINDLTIFDNRNTILDCEILYANHNFVCGMSIISFRQPLIEIDNFGSGQVFTGKNIKRMPNKN